jgi:hypothetical protein
LIQRLDCRVKPGNGQVLDESRFAQLGISHWFTAISESQSEFTLLEIALTERISP